MAGRNKHTHSHTITKTISEEVRSTGPQGSTSSKASFPPATRGPRRLSPSRSPPHTRTCHSGSAPSTEGSESPNNNTSERVSRLSGAGTDRQAEEPVTTPHRLQSARSPFPTTFHGGNTTVRPAAQLHYGNGAAATATARPRHSRVPTAGGASCPSVAGRGLMAAPGRRAVACSALSCLPAHPEHPVRLLISSALNSAGGSCKCGCGVCFSVLR